MKAQKLNFAQVAVLLTFAGLGIAVTVHTIVNNITW
jgi:hypothetical protein